MRGTFYGVGVGPGDPELITLKAVRCIRDCDVIAVPISSRGENSPLPLSMRIAMIAAEEILDKPRLELDMPMSRDENLLHNSHLNAASEVMMHLDNGKSVAFLTLGDPSIYSTYSYLQKILLEDGYRVETVPGVPSFCAAAARLNVSLADGAEPLHIVPASYSGVDEGLEWSGSKVLMKAGKSMAKVKDLLLQKGDDVEVMAVEKCGLKGEGVYTSAQELQNDASYFTVVLVKDKV